MTTQKLITNVLEQHERLIKQLEELDLSLAEFAGAAAAHSNFAEVLLDVIDKKGLQSVLKELTENAGNSTEEIVAFADSIPKIAQFIDIDQEDAEKSYNVAMNSLEEMLRQKVDT